MRRSNNLVRRSFSLDVFLNGFDYPQGEQGEGAQSNSTPCEDVSNINKYCHG